MPRTVRRLFMTGAAILIAGAVATTVGNLSEVRWLTLVGIVLWVGGAIIELVAMSRHVSGRKE
jgi:hypothetical protein